MKQYLRFFISGGFLGLTAWVLQTMIFKAMGMASSGAYMAATLLTYVPLIIINFLIQRRWIFGRPGVFWRFIQANFAIMLLVSLLSPLCRLVIAFLTGGSWADEGGFMLAALLGSVPSFFLMKGWVFHFSKAEFCNPEVVHSD